MKNGFSIIICTFNGKNRLVQTLNHIKRLKIPKGLNIELIVVDNRSNDGTADFVLNFFGPDFEKFNLILLNEPKPGKAYALEKGLNTASFSYSIICDDDNWLDSDYLIEANKLLNSFPEAGIFGGRSIPVFECDIPFWFHGVESAFIIGDQAKDNGFFDQHRNYVWGAGMVLRMEIWKKLTSCNFSFITGKNLNKAVGEDTELAMISNFLGYRFYFSRKLIFNHFMPKSRIKWEVAVTYYKGFGATAPYFALYKRIFQNNGKKLTFFEIEIEILKRTIIVFLTLIRLISKISFKEGNFEYLKGIEKIYYLREIFRLYQFRKKCYKMNYFISILK